MNWKKSVICAIPPIIASCLTAFFWDDITADSPPMAPSAPQQVAQELPVTAPSQTPETTPGKLPKTATDTPANLEPKQTDTAQTAETIPNEQPQDTTPKPSEHYYALLKETATQYSTNNLWLEFVNTPNCLETLVKAVEQLASGNRPLALADFQFLPIPAPFKAVHNNGVYTIAPETEQRFTPVVDAICSITPEKTAQLLNLLQPELDRILHEKLGYPETDTFRKMLVEAMTLILETPEPTSPPHLVKITSTLYRFELQQLEELLHSQKFMLRLGIRNQQKINDFLRKLWKLL